MKATFAPATKIFRLRAAFPDIGEDKPRISQTIWRRNNVLINQSVRRWKEQNSNFSGQSSPAKRKTDDGLAS
jgi:hypothetical protein